jgi:salicylate hydroxylase
MRYYATDREASEQQMQEQSQMSSEEFQDWVFNYSPANLMMT